MSDENEPGPEYHEMMNDLNREHGLPYSIAVTAHGFNVVICVREAIMTFTVEREGCCVGEGTIKWDGCSNWDFNVDGTMPHFCGLSHVKEFHAMMVELYKLAAEHIVTWDTELAE